MRILITGASGYLGSSLAEYFKQFNDTVLGYGGRRKLAGLKQLDITNREAVIKTISTENPDVIIHCVGLVDECQENPHYGRSVNVDGTKNVVEGAKLTRSKIVFISSAAVFDGENGSFSEDHIPTPRSEYGKTKYEAEQIIQSSNLQYLILRPSLIVGFAPLGAHERFFGKMYDALEKEQPIKLDNSWEFTPSLNTHISEVVDWWLKGNKESTILHVATPEATTKYQLAEDLVESLGLNSDLISPKEGLSSRRNLLLVNKLSTLHAPEYGLPHVVRLLATEFRNQNGLKR